MLNDEEEVIFREFILSCEEYGGNNDWADSNEVELYKRLVDYRAAFRIAIDKLSYKHPKYKCPDCGSEEHGICYPHGPVFKIEKSTQNPVCEHGFPHKQCGLCYDLPTKT